MTESISQKAFVDDLRHLFLPLSSDPSDPLYICVRDLLRTTEEFLDLLVAVHNTPLGEAYHIMDTLRLMDFLKHMHKEDMYIRYVHQLVTVQLENQDFVEAGLSLKLHADLYDWDPNTVIAAIEEPVLPQQTAFERKEYLYLQMIKYFEDGKCWSNALDLYKELATQYESHVFDYAKLARCQRAMAKIHENIMKGDRYCPQYFRVAYLGMGFPQGLRDRQFIVEGNHEESLANFTERIQHQHPNAKIVSTGEINNVEGQFVHITPVHPAPDLSHPLYKRAKVNPNTRSYLLSVHPKKFAAVRTPPPTNSVIGPSSPAESTTSNHSASSTPSTTNTELWVEKTLYLTATTFPTILRRAEITSMSTALSSPFENAIVTVHQRTLEMAHLENSYADLTAAPDLDLNPLTMALTSALDTSPAATSTGIFHFRAMLAPGRADALPEWTAALRVAVLDFVGSMKRALSTHGRLVTAGAGGDAMRAVQENMAAHFQHAFAEELRIIAPPVPKMPVPSSPGKWRGPLFAATGGPGPAPLGARPETAGAGNDPRTSTSNRPASASLHRGARTTTGASEGSTTIVPATARAKISNMLSTFSREKSASKRAQRHPHFLDDSRTVASAPATAQTRVEFRRPGTAGSGVTAQTTQTGMSSGGGILKRRPSGGSVETGMTGGSSKSKSRRLRLGSSSKTENQPPPLPTSEYQQQNGNGYYTNPNAGQSRTDIYAGNEQGDGEERDGVSELRSVRPGTTGTSGSKGGLVERMGSVKRRLSRVKLGGQ